MGALPLAPRLADVVPALAHCARGMVLRVPGQAARRRSAHLALVAPGPVRRRPAALGAGPQLPVPLRHEGRVPGNGSALDPDGALRGHRPVVAAEATTARSIDP